MARKGRPPRVNMTVTVPSDVKARVRAFADHCNNRASRIVENAILDYLGDWGTDADSSDDAVTHRQLVDHYLQQFEG